MRSLWNWVKISNLHCICNQYCHFSPDLSENVSNMNNTHVCFFLPKMQTFVSKCGFISIPLFHESLCTNQPRNTRGKNSALEPSNHTFLLHQEDIWKRILLSSGKSQLSVWHIFHLHTLCREQWKAIQREEKGLLTKVQKSNKVNLRKEATVHHLKSGEPTSIYNCFRSVQACGRRRKCQIVTFGILEEANISEISANSSLTDMVRGWGQHESRKEGSYRWVKIKRVNITILFKENHNPFQERSCKPNRYEKTQMLDAPSQYWE